jgi:uncharacterized protein HemY
MNKCLIIIVIFILTACVSTGDSRPAAYLKGETLLQQGLELYKNDDFVQASQKFTAALVWYQSFDNAKGMALSQLNLLETALAINDFAQAQTLLDTLKNQPLASEFSNKFSLLQVKLALQQTHYDVALQKLQPLLAQLDLAQPASDSLLNLLAIQARLEIAIHPLAASTGLSHFQTALTTLASPSAYYQALLNQVLARIAFNQQHYPQANNLLTQALTYYQTQARRRAIADCLEELAEVQRAQRNWQAAKQNLTKALIIRSWLKDSYKSNHLKQQLHALERW